MKGKHLLQQNPANESETEMGSGFCVALMDLDEKRSKGGVPLQLLVSKQVF